MPLRWMGRDFFGCRAFVVGEDLDYPIQINLNNPHEVGADRVVNAVAAAERYPLPLVIVDFGTATTFDVVDEEGSYCGGAIAPGINLSLEALHLAAAKLPRIAVEPPENVIGTSTIAAMQSGVFWGYIGLIEGLVGRIQAEYGKPMAVIATGGLAPLFVKRCPVLQHHRPGPDHGRAAGNVHDNRELIRSGKGHAREVDRSAFVPLGGVGEIGMNAYLYGRDGRWTDGRSRASALPTTACRASTSCCRISASSSSGATFSTGWSSPTRTRTISVPCPICGRGSAARSGARPSPPPCCARKLARDRFRSRCADPRRRAGPGV